MQNKPEQMTYAGFFVRVAAHTIDALLVGAVLLFIRIPVWALTLNNPGNFITRDLIFNYSITDIVFYLLKISYFIILTYHSGATIGKKLLNLQVISVEDRKMTLLEVIYRESVGKFLAGVFACVGYFMIGVDMKKQGLHDKLADTVVVYKHTLPKTEEEKLTYTPANYMQEETLPEEVLEETETAEAIEEVEE